MKGNEIMILPKSAAVAAFGMSLLFATLPAMADGWKTCTYSQRVRNAGPTTLITGDGTGPTAKEASAEAAKHFRINWDSEKRFYPAMRAAGERKLVCK